MLEVIIRPRAERDLTEIWRFTRQRWSHEQADLYLKKLNAVIGSLAKRPQLGRPSDNISPGLLRRPAERHVIYYRVKEKSLLVVRVLHDAMDPVMQLANDDS